MEYELRWFQSGKRPASLTKTRGHSHAPWRMLDELLRRTCMSGGKGLGFRSWGEELRFLKGKGLGFSMISTLHRFQNTGSQ